MKVIYSTVIRKNGVETRHIEARFPSSERWYPEPMRTSLRRQTFNTGRSITHQLLPFCLMKSSQIWHATDP